MRAPPAGRPTPKLAGDRPKERRAPTRRLDRPLLCFNLAGTHELILDGGLVSEVVRRSGTMVWNLVFQFWALLGWSIAFLSFCTAPRAVGSIYRATHCLFCSSPSLYVLCHWLGEHFSYRTK